MNVFLTVLAALSWLNAAHAAPVRTDAPAFTVYSVDDQGGGWVIHHLAGRGDTLWGCVDVARAPEACIQVFFAAWRTGTQLDMLHVGSTTQRSWLRLRAPGWGDDLLACYDPEIRPRCERVQLTLRPTGGLIERSWPDYETDAPSEAARVIEPEAKADMWIEVGAPATGAVNLYACIGLAAEQPHCRVGLPNLLRIEREPLGLRRLKNVRPVADAPSEGVFVDRVDVGSAAWDAGLRPAMVIVGVGGFPATEADRVLDIAAQYPAGTPFQVLLNDGTSLEITPRQRRPRR